MSSTSSTVIFINLIGSAALLVWGLGTLRKGMDRAFGTQMRFFLAAGTSNRVKAFGVGLFITLILQSSTATAVMTSSFVEQGLIGLAMALGIMLGADVGTSLVAQLVSLKIQWLSPLCILAGVAIPRIIKSSKGKGIGLSFMGLGLMLLSLRLMGEATAPMRESEIIRLLFSMLGDAPLFAVIAAAFMASIAASSLAVVLFVMSLYQSGAIEPVLCILFVVGANLGGAIPPLFIAGNELAARQVILGNLFIRAIGALLVVTFSSFIATLIAPYDFGARLAVDVHVAFNLSLAIIFLPLLNPVARLICRLAPVSEEMATNSPKFLDETALLIPVAALAAAKREVLRIGDTAERMLETSLDTLRNDDERLYETIHGMDDKIDHLQEAIKQYIFRLGRAIDLNSEQTKLATEIISYAINLEHVGDIIEKNLSTLARKKGQDRLNFSAEGFSEIEIMYMRTIENMHLAQTVFMTHDAKLARKLVESKIEIRQMEIQSATSHLERYQKGRVESIQSSSLHLDILRDLKRINAHLTSAAYPILSDLGVLRESRLRADE